MAPNRTKTIKNKHAAPKGGAKRSATDGVSKLSKKPKTKNGKGGATVSQQVKEKGLAGKLLKRPKKKVYSEKELGIPALNMVTPVGVVKPKGLKKGKVFVDDKESMSTILSIVQAEKEGHIESKMIKARQMEEIREARRVEAEKRAEDKKSKLEDTKESLRKRRKRKNAGEEDSLKSISLTGTKATKMKKRVAFA